MTGAALLLAVLLAAADAGKIWPHER